MKTLATLFALSLALSASFALGRNTDPQASAGPSNAALLKQVKKANRSLSLLKQQIGLVNSQVNSNLAVVNNGVNTLKVLLGGPFSPQSVLGWLRQVCANTGRGCY